MNVSLDFLESLNIYGWRDFVEIIFFSGIFYYLSLWLKRDVQKPLLLTFYGYALLLGICHMSDLPAITSSLIAFAPALLIIFIVLHQTTLQKNFIALHTLTPQHSFSRSLPDLLIQTFLIAATDGKTVRCVIERKNSLSTFLHAPYTFQCPLAEGLLDLLIESPSFNQEKLVWITDHAILVALNSSWIKSSVDHWLTQKENVPQWIQDALFYTTKTDAFFIAIDPNTRTFTVLSDGACIEHLSANAALIFLKKQLLFHAPLSTKGVSYDTRHKNTHSSQQSQS